MSTMKKINNLLLLTVFLLVGSLTSCLDPAPAFPPHPSPYIPITPPYTPDLNDNNRKVYTLKFEAVYHGEHKMDHVTSIKGITHSVPSHSALKIVFSVKDAEGKNPFQNENTSEGKDITTSNNDFIFVGSDFLKSDGSGGDWIGSHKVQLEDGKLSVKLPASNIKKKGGYIRLKYTLNVKPQNGIISSTTFIIESIR